MPTKAVTLAVGNGELALRAVAVAASILALIVFWRLTRSLLGPVGALVATAAFAMNPLLISLASVVKQYATDALATVLVLVALRWLSQHEGSLRRRVLVGLGAGAIGVLSIPSIVVAGAAITALLYHSWQSGRLRRKESATYALAPLVVWGTVALGAAAGEPIFAHVWSRSALAYYGPGFGVADAVVFGSDAFSVREDLARLDAFRGESSLWVLFTHSANRDFLLCYLDEIGVALDHVIFPGGMRHNPASLHRYDLSDEARRASTDAGRARVTAESFHGDPPRCRRPRWPTASSPYRLPLLPASIRGRDSGSR